ncbi:hypothetical protein M9194_06175 [Vibrio sp. S4M6]|uniref:type VI secretion system tube protein IglC n=1 Tax=Vibrio sinus TaxID=2946865 RepID=UPI00202A2BCE|nr:type VI secretion system tube protein IglC [Vibrio sinus]MCL9781010.1 hypothetical protein [Vibrio sinus]
MTQIMNMEPMIDRSVVEESKNLSFTFNSLNAFSEDAVVRCWFDTVSIFGVELGKDLFALEGDQARSECNSPTAAAVLSAFDMAPPHETGSVMFEIHVALTAANKNALKTAIANVRKGKATDNTIVFGTPNESQELKNDGKWSFFFAPKQGLTLIPCDPRTVDLEIGNGELLGGTTADAPYTTITGFNFVIDGTTWKEVAIDVGHDSSSDKGLYATNNVSAAG